MLCFSSVTHSFLLTSLPKTVVHQSDFGGFLRPGKAAEWNYCWQNDCPRLFRSGKWSCSRGQCGQHLPIWNNPSRGCWVWCGHALERLHDQGPASSSTWCGSLRGSEELLSRQQPSQISRVAAANCRWIVHCIWLYKYRHWISFACLFLQFYCGPLVDLSTSHLSWYILPSATSFVQVFDFHHNFLTTLVDAI